MAKISHLCAGRCDASSGHFDVILAVAVLLAFGRWIILRFVAVDPVGHCLAYRSDDGLDQVLLVLDGLAQWFP